MDVLKYIPKGVSSKVARQLLIAQKHSPRIMFVSGIAGVVTTTVLASRATLKLYDVLEEAQSELATIHTAHETVEKYTDEFENRDRAIVYVRTGLRVAKLYAPAVGVGVISVGLLTGSHVVLTRRNTGLAAAYTALDKGFAQYRERVVEKYGEEEDRNLRYAAESVEVTRQTDKGPKTENVMAATFAGRSIYARIFDEGSKYWKREYGYNQMFVMSQQNWMNDRLRAYGHVFLNEVYDALGLPRSPEGAVVGWVHNGEGDGFIDFGVFTDGNQFESSRFVNGDERSVLLDFNVDGVIYNLI